LNYPFFSIPIAPGLICIAILVAVGLFLLISAQGYRFTGGICVGAALVIGTWMLLDLLSNIRPEAASWGKLILSACIVAGLAAALITGIIIGMASLGRSGEQYDYLILLGAGVNGTEPSVCLLERIDAAQKYLQNHPGTVCIPTGGQGKYEQMPEGACAARELIARGIPESRVWAETRSSSTLQNIRFAIDLIESRTGSRPQVVGVVSNEYHLYRAAMFARQLGVTARGVPAHTKWIFLRTNYFLREIVAVWFYRIFRR